MLGRQGDCFEDWADETADLTNYDFYAVNGEGSAAIFIGDPRTLAIVEVLYKDGKVE